jgi:hypothetical protein
MRRIKLHDSEMWELISGKIMPKQWSR